VDIPRINSISNRHVDPSTESSQDRKQKEKESKSQEQLIISQPKPLNPSKQNTFQQERAEESQTELNRQIIDTEKVIDLLAHKPEPTPPKKHPLGVKFSAPKITLPNKKEEKFNKSF